MSAAVANQASGPFWRAAGMTYVAYVNTCSSLVRKCLKEPHKSEAATREQVFYKVSMWEEGIPQKSVALLAFCPSPSSYHIPPPPGTRRWGCSIPKLAFLSLVYRQFLFGITGLSLGREAAAHL
ncbi:hypothetical protein GOP47_0019730 [Adiantum capillus-veneris]|uniref:ATP synthase subunit epsilon, mitochondrial n=1 Tax=Adiantum capillus-veneris TaxID=13818 RepID=A0A9D4Z8R7_ADICA|nr:hypothetical protein GOP47_0019730 [Adiantum capillus-veneris]